MSTNFDNLRNCRDFLSRLLDLPEDEAFDLLTNHGEEQVTLFNQALGHDAFKVGDPVMVQHAIHGEFMGTVVAIRTDKNGPIIFTVKDQDDDAFDCEAEELIPNQD